MDELRDSILVWSRRARLQRSVALAPFGLACGLGIALILALASRAFPLLDSGPLIVISIVLALAGLAAAFAFPWVRHTRTSVLQWARKFDHEFGLKERISTALEVNDGNLSVKNDAIRNLQRKDAGSVLQGINVKERLPLKFSRRDAVVALVFVALLAIAIALPNPQQQILAQREELRQTIAQQIQQLEQARETIEKSNLTDAQKQLALEALNNAEKRLEDPNVTPEEALAAINEAQSTLDTLNDEAAQQQADDLRRAGESMSPDELTNSLANSLANENFDQAAEQMRNLTNDANGQPLSDDQAQRTASQLDQLARSVQNSDPQMAQQLRDAAQKLREGNAQAAQDALNQAAQSLQQAQQNASASQALQQAQAQADAARQAIAEQASQQANAQSGPQAQQSQNGESQAGQESPQGQGVQPGQTNSDSGTTGAGAEAGSEQGQTAAAAAAAASGNPTGQAQKSDDFGSDDSVYAPQRVGGDGKQVVLPDTQGQPAPNPNGRPSTAPGGNSSVPYQQVYGDYAKAADEAMQTGEVPADRRDYVRDYFSSLDPNQQTQQSQQTTR